MSFHGKVAARDRSGNAQYKPCMECQGRTVKKTCKQETFELGLSRFTGKAFLLCHSYSSLDSISLTFSFRCLQLSQALTRRMRAACFFWSGVRGFLRPLGLFALGECSVPYVSIRPESSLGRQCMKLSVFLDMLEPTLVGVKRLS